MALQISGIASSGVLLRIRQHTTQHRVAAGPSFSFTTGPISSTRVIVGSRNAHILVMAATPSDSNPTNTTSGGEEKGKQQQQDPLSKTRFPVGLIIHMASFLGVLVASLVYFVPGILYVACSPYFTMLVLFVSLRIQSKLSDRLSDEEQEKLDEQPLADLLKEAAIVAVFTTAICCVFVVSFTLTRLLLTLIAPSSS
ncbi:hypothetical protein LINGRAHAP2_LOCUS12742 [Linum grandiflorum]